MRIARPRRCGRSRTSRSPTRCCASTSAGARTSSRRCATSLLTRRADGDARRRPRRRRARLPRRQLRRLGGRPARPVVDAARAHRRCGLGAGVALRPLLRFGAADRSGRRDGLRAERRRPRLPAAHAERGGGGAVRAVGEARDRGHPRRARLSARVAAARLLDRRRRSARGASTPPSRRGTSSSPGSSSRG